MGNLVKVKNFKNEKRFREREKVLSELKNKISEGYKSDIRQFQFYCDETEQEENLVSFIDYLYFSVNEQKVKKTTWEKRLTAIKKYFSVVFETNFKKELDFMEEVSLIRKLYNEERFSSLKRVEGKKRVNRGEMLEIISKLDIRKKAICMVNLITANRPSEMVRLKISDFDLENNSVSIYMKKQKEWHEKRLTQEVVILVREYIVKYGLKKEDYFVGSILSNGTGKEKYVSKQISEEAYRKMLQNSTGWTAYNFRKTQVSSMHEKGADLPAIAKQTGHKSIKTISDHYLNVSDSTIDKYL